ncbi:hypothetical protein LCGC14_1034090 [marine sediment metagenome]|uniref:Uncharacterized protein n=1 Tax=marine sediment metagenome TaxID=412755 RepID=A0A0F9NFD0_9ZZZZ
MAGIKHNFMDVQRMITRAERNLGPLVEDTMVSICRYVLRRVQINMSGRILHKRSGRLYNAWGYEVRPIGRDRIRGTIGTLLDNPPYDIIHDTGGQAGPNRSVTIPARRYYSRVPEEGNAQINRIIGNKIKRLHK